MKTTNSLTSNSKTTSPSLSSPPFSNERARRRPSASLVNVIRQSPRLSINTLSNLFCLFHCDADVQSFVNCAATSTPRRPLRVVCRPRQHSRKVSSLTSFRCDGVHLQSFESFESQGLGSGELSGPRPRGCALSVDACYLYVADCHNHRVHVFDASSGAHRHSFGSSLGSEPEQFKHPMDVYVSSTGQLFVCDTGNHRVQVLDGVTGAYVRTIGTGVRGRSPGQLNFPEGVVVSRQLVYVVDWCNHHVSVFNESDGTFLHTFGTPGPGDGQFSSCYKIAASALSGDVYVVDGDLSTRRVQVFSETGEFRRVLCSTATHAGVIGRPLFVCVSATDDVYVSDIDKHCVHIFDSTGAYVRAIKMDALFSGEFAWSHEVSHDGRMFVVDFQNRRVCAFE